MLKKEYTIFGASPFVDIDLNLDNIILISKLYIYRCKVNKILPSLGHLKNIIFTRNKIEQAMESRNFKERWEPYQNIFMGLMPD